MKASLSNMYIKTGICAAYIDSCKRETELSFWIVLCNRAETFADVTPTVGFSKFVTRHRGISVNIYDLGGSSRIRDIWKNYFAETHGVVFVIDASDPSRLQEAKQSLTNLMKHTLLKGKPLLLYVKYGFK